VGYSVSAKSIRDTAFHGPGGEGLNVFLVCEILVDFANFYDAFCAGILTPSNQLL